MDYLGLIHRELFAYEVQGMIGNSELDCNMVNKQVSIVLLSILLFSIPSHAVATKEATFVAVSYTHLTLPTILLV